jgi:transposase InsO family protein
MSHDWRLASGGCGFAQCRALNPDRLCSIDFHFELRALGVRCARKRAARLMREAGLFGCGGRRRRVRTTLGSRTERTHLRLPTS